MTPPVNGTGAKTGPRKVVDNTRKSPPSPEEARAHWEDGFVEPSNEVAHDHDHDLPALWLHELGDLSDTPPKRPWFMRDLRTGKGLLRPGKVAVLSADGGVGKSMVELQLAVCVALGLPLFDVLQPESAGYVALLMGEDDAAECWERLHRICNAMHLDREQRATVAKRVLLFPLAGKQVSFLTVDEFTKTARWAEVLGIIIRQLTEQATSGGFEWTLLELDPLARFAGANAESDNERATMFVQGLESLVERVPGKPACLCSHHTSKVGIRAGRSDTRGVTGLRNAFRAEFIMERVEHADGYGVLFDNRKNNGAVHAKPIWLIQLDNEQMPNGSWLATEGVFRQANETEAEVLATAAGVTQGDPDARRVEREKKRNLGKIDRAQARREAILACLPVEPEYATTGEVEAEFIRQGVTKLNRGTAPELRELCALNLAKDLSDGSRGKPRMWCAVRKRSI